MCGRLDVSVDYKFYVLLRRCVHASVSVTNLLAAWCEWDHAVHWFNGGYSTIGLCSILCSRNVAQRIMRKVFLDNAMEFYSFLLEYTIMERDLICATSDFRIAWIICSMSFV